MKIKTLLVLAIIAAAAYVTIDYIRLTPGWRMHGWEMFTKTSDDFLAQPTWGTAANAHLPTSGKGLFPESPYIFSQGWHLFHIHNWEKHLQHLQGKPDVHGLEIGSFEGMSSIWVLENIFTHPTATMTCIDLFDRQDFEDTFDHNAIATGTPRKIIKVKGPSEHMIRGLDINKFDFVYIDGCHLPKWALSDAVMSWETLKPGGLMIFDDYKHIESRPTNRRFTGIRFIDDYLWNRSGQYLESPKPAIDAFLKIYDPYLDVVFKGYQVVIKKK